MLRRRSEVDCRSTGPFVRYTEGVVVGADHVFVFNYLSILKNKLYVFYIEVINVLPKVFDGVNGKW